MKVEKVHSVKQLPVEVYSTALLIGEAVIEVEKIIQPLIKFHAPSSTWELILRIGITTGPALHGLLKTDSLINADVVGALEYFFSTSNLCLQIQVNLASRCQTAGKDLQVKIKDLGIQDLGKEEDRILCTVVSDMATHDANSQIADGGSQLKVDTRIIQQARCNIGAIQTAHC